MKPKVLKKSASIKTTAKPLWPWFSFIFVVFVFGFIPFFIKAANKQFTNALSISFVPSQTANPPQFQAGQSLTVAISLKDSNEASAQSKNGYTLAVNACPASSGVTDYDSCAGRSGSVVLTPQPRLGTGSNAQNFIILLPATGFQSGAYNLFFVMQYVDVGHNGFGYMGTAAVNVTGATQGTTAVLKIQPPASGQKSADGIQVEGNFGISFTPAASGAVPDHFTYDCGNGKTGSVLYSQANYGFICTYPSSQKNYTVTLTAFASKDSTQPIGSPVNSPFSVTGNETVQGGAGTGSSSGPDVAGKLAEFLNELIGTILAIIQFAIYGIFAYLIAPIIVAVLSIHTYQDSFVAVIYPGWETIRNLCNIFFIVSLIVIAMATLFRVESYKARHLLVQLIIAALLINFSLVIGQAVLAVADTVQTQFLPANVQSINVLAQRLMTTNNSSISAWFQTPGIFSSSSNTATAQAVNGSLFGGILASLFWLAMSLGTFAVFCAIAAFLVIRVIALWLLLMISPVAYAVGVLPSTAQYRTKWWQEFLKYAFFTPIMAFFLSMAAVMVNNAQNNPVLMKAAQDAGLFGSNSIGPLVVTIGSNILLLVFLIASLKVADLAGVYGAKGITDLATKGIYLPFGAAAFGGKAAGSAFGRAYTRWTTKNLEAADKSGRTKTANAWRAAQFLNPIVVKKAWEARSKEKEAEAYEPATGYVRDSIGRLIPTEWHKEHGKLKLGQKTYYGRVGQATMIAHKRSEWEKAPLSEEEKVQAALDAHHSEDIEALQYIIQDGRHEDGFMIEYMKRNRAKYVAKLAEDYLNRGRDKNGNAIANATAAKAAAEKDFVPYYDKVEYMSIVADMFKHAGLSDEQIGEKLSHLQEHAEAETKERGLGMALYEDHDKSFRSISDFSGYQKLEATQSKEKMLNFLEETEKFEVLGRNAAGDVTALRFHVQDDLGNNTGEDYDVTDFNSLQSAMAATGTKYGSVYDHGRQADLKYELTGARSNMDAQKRKERGNSERWAGAIEPAADTVQFGDGSFKYFTSYGRTSIRKRPTATVVSLGRTRVVQSRAIKRLGLYKGRDGKFDLRSKAAGGNTDYEMMAQLFYMNPNEANNLLGRAGLDKSHVQDIQRELTTHYAPYVASIIGKTIKDATDSSGALFEFK